jgi:DNA-binding Xre family transcriptional regulator
LRSAVDFLSIVTLALEYQGRQFKDESHMSTQITHRKSIDRSRESLVYRRIAEVSHYAGTVRVVFVNGDEVRVAASSLLPSGVRAPEWDRVATDGVELEVPAAEGPAYVLWESIRELTDPDFAEKLKDTDAEYRIRTGRQLRQLRETRGLTGRYVASSAGINNQSLSRIEHRHRGVTLTNLRHILDAMGCTLQDMIDEEDEGDSSIDR